MGSTVSAEFRTEEDRMFTFGSRRQGWKSPPQGLRFFVTAFVAAWSLAAGSLAEAAPIVDRYVTIQPIQVCDPNCAPFNAYPVETMKIHTQADVAPVFLPSTTLSKSSPLTVEGIADIDKPGNGQLTANGTTVNLWFVNTLTTAPGFVLYGMPISVKTGCDQRHRTNSASVDKCASHGGT